MALLRRTGEPHPPSLPQLRLDQRPTPWMPMIVGGSLAGLVLISVAAAAVVKVDQVLPVPGTLEPIRSTQDFSPPELGVVSQVLVKEGEKVRKDQPLVRLNPVILEGRQVALKQQNSEIGRISRAELDRLRGAIGEAQAESQGLQAEREIILEQLRRLEQLEQEGGASRFQLLEYRKQLGDLNARLSRNRQTLERLNAESRQKQAELRQQAAENQANRVETEQRLRQVVIRASLDGTILNLKAKPGLVANVDEVMLQLVPDDNLQASVYVPNRDLAFVRPGQEAELAVEAYDTSRYGRLAATVDVIGMDSLPPGETEANYTEPRFPVSLKLSAQTLERDGRSYPLQAGMAVTANLKLERRTMLNLLYSMVTRSGDAVRTIR